MGLSVATWTLLRLSMGLSVATWTHTEIEHGADL